MLFSVVNNVKNMFSSTAVKSLIIIWLMFLFR